MVTFLLAGAVGYLLGSFPTGYLLVRWKADLDIRQHGSGNVGTLNSFEVTNSKAVGAGVLLLDLLKGLASVLLARHVVSPEFPVLATAGIAAVVGHNFPVWLRFQGGRGLATAAGVMLLLGWVLVPVWMGAWFVGKLLSKDVNVGNAVGTLSILAAALSTSPDMLAEIIPANASVATFRIYVAVLAMVILLRLIEPVAGYIVQRRAGTGRLAKEDVEQ